MVYQEPFVSELADGHVTDAANVRAEGSKVTITPTTQI